MFRVAILIIVPAGLIAQEIRLGDAIQVGQPSSILRRLATAERQIIPSTWFDTTNRQTIAASFLTDYQPLENTSLGWTGNVSQGIAGDTSAAYRDAVRQRINWFRAMAGVPAWVTFDPVKNSKGQKGALMMAANSSITHNPPMNWMHYTVEGAEALANSNVCVTHRSEVGCVEQYMEDHGDNNRAAGHRRWFLYPNTRSMGTGDVLAGNVQLYNATWVIDENIWAQRPQTREAFVAWPPPGFVPYPVLFPRWHFSYPNADFRTAEVSMLRNGAPVSVVTEPLTSNVGDNTIVWVPQGFNVLQYGFRLTDTADTIWDVTIRNAVVNGELRTFTYRVIGFDPVVYTLGTPSLPNVPASGGSGTISVTSVPQRTNWLPSADVPWISVNQVSGAIFYVVGPNSGPARSGTIRVGGASVVITQAGGTGNTECAFNLSQSEVISDGSLNSSTFQIVASDPQCSWTASLNPRWAHVFPTSGKGTTTLRYTIYPNFSTAQRQFTFLIGGRPLQITQSGGAGTVDERFVRLLYFNFFGRVPSPGEVAFQVSSGLSRATLAHNFLNSLEFNQGGRFVAGLYLGLLNRVAEYNGWLFQRNALASWNVTSDQLVSNFINSAEFNLKYPNYSSAQFVTLLYQQVLGRTPAQWEVDFQVNAIASGTSRVAIARNFLNSEEFRRGTYAKLLAFLMYATLLNRDPSPVEYDVRLQQLQTGTSPLTMIAQFVTASEFSEQFR